ncbi:hypothetical protein FACUT_1665 [Fusarium acutatum]|uniref:2EXR domain-containing protein n=1 Tax=Fusarium acutatum TaxID=78861 RepID=A0A8H4K3Z5_9HYPO|nr:hypothetical protein FACUT_1665 [Fusarium acutatum]
MKPSEIQPANEGLSTSTCFSRLPLEIREMIWECLISVQRHLRIEGRFGKPAKIGSFSIPEGLYLSRICSESRNVLSRIIAYQAAEDGDGAPINRRFNTVLLTTVDAPSLETLSSLTTDIDHIAVPRLAVGQVEKLHLALQKRVAAGRRQIKVIYHGRKSYLQNQRRPPGNYLVTPPVDFYIMTDDPVSFLGPDKRFIIRTTEGETDSHFFNYALWHYDQYPKGLRSTWTRLTSKDGIPAPVMKPSIILIPSGLETF